MENDFLDYRNSTFVITESGIKHVGIKGKSGRYPLGSGADPYQDYPNLRRKKSDRVLVKDMEYQPKSLLQKHKENKIAKKKAKQRKEALEKARKTKLENQEARRVKNEIIEKGNAAAVYKYKEYLTNEEKQRALERINWDLKLADAKNNEWQKTQRKIDLIAKNAENLGKISSGVWTTYDSVSKIYNKASGSNNSNKNNSNNNSKHKDNGLFDYISNDVGKTMNNIAKSDAKKEAKEASKPNIKLNNKTEKVFKNDYNNLHFNTQKDADKYYDKLEKEYLKQFKRK